MNKKDHICPLRSGGGENTSPPFVFPLLFTKSGGANKPRNLGMHRRIGNVHAPFDPSLHMDEGQTHSSSHSLSDSLGDDLGETHISGASTSSSKETRGPSIGVSKELPESYEKVIIKLNEWGQPDEPKEEVDHFITKLGHIARRDIPIHYDSWKPVRSHESIIPKAIKTLGRMYVFENIDTIYTDWTISKFQKVWKEYKHELFKKYVKDQPPSFVREHPKQGIPLQDWRQFVDNCNSEKFKASSLRNTENRKQQNNSSCLGRKSVAVAKVEMAKEKGVHVSSITRLDQYMHNHKRKNGEHQDPELVEKLNDYTALHPESRETSVNDALTKVLGPDSRGCFRGMGEGVCKTSVKKMKVMAQQNLALKEMNTDLVKRVVNEYIGKECDLRGGWPLRVAWREVSRQDIDPNTEFGNRRLEEGNFKVHVSVVYEFKVFVLPLPHDDWRSKHGEVASRSVIRPKNY
ncbi:hypothetical protein IFM89_024127 [Coptis chinensis]|uniref:Transposase n=1 Tax=Coptis chinensis TaxID=261450 RepID=A0A835H8H5_9MAGN|nr:hypothetical protein IFM89_024127 [Coptis chinensis]